MDNFCQCFFLPLRTERMPVVIKTIPAMTDITHTIITGELLVMLSGVSLKISSTVLSIMYIPINKVTPPSK